MHGSLVSVMGVVSTKRVVPACRALWFSRCMQGSLVSKYIAADGREVSVKGWLLQSRIKQL